MLPSRDKACCYLMEEKHNKERNTKCWQLWISARGWEREREKSEIETETEIKRQAERDGEKEGRKEERERSREERREQTILGVQYILNGRGSVTDITKIPVQHNIQHKHTLTPCIFVGLTSPWREKTKGRGNSSSWLLSSDLWVKAVGRVPETNWVFVFCALSSPVRAKYAVGIGTSFSFSLLIQIHIKI